jgi:hypothetical protein
MVIKRFLQKTAITPEAANGVDTEPADKSPEATKDPMKVEEKKDDASVEAVEKTSGRNEMRGKTEISFS